MKEYHINIDDLPDVIMARNLKDARKKVNQLIDIVSSEELRF